jgi:ribonuclease Z
MLKTFALRGRDQLPLTVYGPSGIKSLFGALRPFIGRLPYPLDLVELEPGQTLDRSEYVLEAFAVEHGVDALGYALVEHERPGRFDVSAADALGVPPGRERGVLQAGDPLTLPDGTVITPDEVLGPARSGRKLVISGDTAPSPHVVQAAHGADVLVHEATFGKDEQERAEETMHATAAQAAEVARLAGVRLLALTHVSTRYFGGELRDEAREIFPDVVVPRDFDVVEIPFSERGEPRLVKAGARPVSSGGDGADGSSGGGG